MREIPSGLKQEAPSHQKNILPQSMKAVETMFKSCTCAQFESSLKKIFGELFFNCNLCRGYRYNLLPFVVFTLFCVPCRKREAFHGNSSSTSSDSSDSGTETSDEQRFSRRKAKSMAKARSRCAFEKFVSSVLLCVNSYCQNVSLVT